MPRRVFVSFFVLVFSLFVSSSNAAPSKSKYDFNLPSISEKKTKLSDYSNKVVVVTFWASWCEPCKRQIAWLKKLQGDLATSSLVIVAINEDFEQGSANKFLQRHGTFNFPTLIDKNHKTFERFGAKSPAALYVFDRDGELLFEVEGSYPQIQETVEKIIREAI